MWYHRAPRLQPNPYPYLHRSARVYNTNCFTSSKNKHLAQIGSRAWINLIANWAAQELGAAQFGDARLAARGIRVLDALLTHAQSSIPAACQSWAATKGAYRFFNNNNVTSTEMFTSHHQQLRHRITDRNTVLVAQDTTTLNLSNKQIAGVGLVGDGGSRKNPLQGLYVHTGFVMDTDGLPLGLTTQKVYARKADHGKRNIPLGGNNCPSQAGVTGYAPRHGRRP